MTTISILGSGWLGLPLAQYFVSQNYKVKLSTRSKDRQQQLIALNLDALLVDIDQIDIAPNPFWQSTILVINIPSKNISGFEKLIRHIEQSAIDKVIFVSSTSVYKNSSEQITESDVDLLTNSPLVIIEKMFKQSKKFTTTIIRFGGLIGYSRHPGRFFSGGKLLKDPEARVNLIHRDDCINIISEVIKQQVWGQVFNACADSHPTKRQFYSQAATQYGEGQPLFAATSSPTYKVIDSQKVKQILDYQFVHADLMKIQF